MCVCGGGYNLKLGSFGGNVILVEIGWCLAWVLIPLLSISLICCCLLFWWKSCILYLLLFCPHEVSCLKLKTLILDQLHNRCFGTLSIQWFLDQGFMFAHILNALHLLSLLTYSRSETLMLSPYRNPRAVQVWVNWVTVFKTDSSATHPLFLHPLFLLPACPACARCCLVGVSMEACSQKEASPTASCVLFTESCEQERQWRKTHNIRKQLCGLALSALQLLSCVCRCWCILSSGTTLSRLATLSLAVKLSDFSFWWFFCLRRNHFFWNKTGIFPHIMYFSGYKWLIG